MVCSNILNFLTSWSNFTFFELKWNPEVHALSHKFSDRPNPI